MIATMAHRTIDSLSPSEAKLALSLLDRQDRKKIAREKLYEEIRSKNSAWYASKSKK